MTREILFEIYDPSKQNEWDNFILQDSVNGTFMQTRMFLSYHGENKFNDCSLIFRDKKSLAIIAVIPAATCVADGKKVFHSHPGATFGGIVFSKKFFKFIYVHDVIEMLEIYCKENNYSKIIIKNTPQLFSIDNSELVEFALSQQNFTEYKELNTYVDYLDYKENVLSNFTQAKRTCVNKCLKTDWTSKEISSKEEIEDFYNLLDKTLAKYSKHPVHSVSDIQLLKNTLIPNNVKVFGVYDKDVMIAGSLVFIFENGVVHTQYLCADYDYPNSPMTYIYYLMIDYFKNNSATKISFGISNKHNVPMNENLIFSKESFGSKHSINCIFEKDLL